MYIFGTMMPTHARTKQIAAHSEILRRVNKGGMRRIIDKMMLIRANLSEVCKNSWRRFPRMHLPDYNNRGCHSNPKDKQLFIIHLIYS